MLAVLIILAVVLVVVMAISLMGAGPSRVIRRRTIVERRPAQPAVWSRSPWPSGSSRSGRSPSRPRPAGSWSKRDRPGVDDRPRPAGLSGA